tara:strand:- start:569 stop:1147 length:579 start_codon:yes stop_codon:yes gene_type:complete
MTLNSPLSDIIQKGSFGNSENRNSILINEISNIYIVQIAKYKNSTQNTEDIKINGLNLPTTSGQVNSSKEERILWNGPNNWLYISLLKNPIDILESNLNKNNFAITDLSHSRTIISLEGIDVKEVLKKGCPFNFNNLKKNNCANSVFNGITLTIDVVEDNPDKIYLYVLRSFGESFYHAITDATLEFGYKIT